jgi:hypothetical protein
MKPTRTFPTLIVLAVLLAGCAAYKSAPPYNAEPLTAFTDPAFKWTVFRRIAVVADTSNLEWRLKLESRLAETLTEYGTRSVRGSTLFPPTRQWSDAARRAALLADSVDGFLTLTITESSARTKYIPAVTSTTVTQERKAKEKTNGRDTSNYEEVNVITTTRQDGGYTENTPLTRYTIKLIDVATGQTAWMATNRIDGDPDDRLWSFCQEIVAQLQRDGLVRKNQVAARASE